MVDEPALRRVVLALPGVHDASGPKGFVFEVQGKGFAWSYLERVAPKKPRQPRRGVLAVRCPLDSKEMLIAAAPERFFDDEHYRGYPAVLVRLEAVDEDELAGLLARAHAMVSQGTSGRR